MTNATDPRLTELVRQVADAEAALQEYLSGQVDGVLNSDGHTFLLRGAQQSLLDSEAAQRRLAQTQTAVLDALPQNIAVVNCAGVITAVNAAWRQFANENQLADPHYGVGKNYVALCPEEVRTGLLAVLRGERQEYSGEYPCHSPEARRWYRLVVTPLHNDGLAGAVVAHVNVTERRRAEEANRLQAFLLDNIGQAVIATDLQGSIIYANRFAGQLYGWGAADVRGQQITDIVVAEPDRGRAEQIMQQLQAGQPWTGEFPVRRRDGSMFTAWVANSALTDEHGQLSGIIGISSDITEKKLAEERLKRSESLLRLSGQMARLGWWTAELATGTVIWSDEVCAIHEVPAGTVLTPEEGIAFYTEESQLVVRHHFEECCRYATPFDLELEIVTARGRHVAVRVIGSAEKDHSGVVTTVRGAFQDISELKAAADENRRLAERLSTTLESITDAFVTLDRDWRYTYVNGQAERLLRRPRSALLGRSIWDEFPPARSTEVEEQFRESLRSGLPRHFEHYYQPLQVWFDMQTYPSEQGLAVYFRDVTEQREAREAARASEERFRLLSKATRDAIWDWDIEQGTVWWNEGFGTLFGDTDDGADHVQRWSARVHPEDLAGVWNMVQEVIAGSGCSFQSEYRFRRADGSYAYVLDRGHVIRNKHGKAVRIIGGITDLSQRREAEEKLAQQASLLDKAQDAIMVRDLDHSILYWNQSAERLYGYSAAEAIGRNCPELLGIDMEAFESAFQDLLQAGDWVGEWTQQDRHGRVCQVQSRWTLVRDDAGQPRSVLVINTDVTERRKLEQQFLRAQRMESIGTLAGGIAHDLNNILAPIMLAIPLLQAEEEDHDKLETLDTIADSARRGAEMVQQVLSFARGVDGKREAVSVAELLKGIEKIANDTFMKNVQVITSVEPALPPVCGDSTQLHQVLLNLCVNARDAMPDGGTLRLSARAVECPEGATLPPNTLPGPYVCIEVADSGCGMPPDIMDKIFEPFFTTKEQGRGTGLGLSTSLGIVKSHGGFIQVESRENHGTTFAIYLPCPEDSLPAVPKPAAAQSPRGRGELVLIVDDEPAVRQITEKTLQACGYSTLTASDGVQGLSVYALHRDAVAVVVTDIMMPVLDGPTMVQALRRINPDVRVIGVSGVLPSKTTLAGVDRFIPKPYSAETLTSAVAEVLAV